MSRWPVRLRLALVFAAASAVVLPAVGAILYTSVRETLAEQISEHPATRIDALEDRNEVLDTLLALLLVLGPLALLLAAVAGYRLAAAALRPVESMRREAAEELGAAIRSAAEEVERLIRLAEALLVLDRAGEAALRPEELDARELLGAVAKRYGARAAAAGRAIEVEGGGTFHGDRDRLEQALGDLADNALTHGRGTVRLEAARAGEEIVLRVADEGAGFPAGFAPRAFERFSRVDEARTGGGAGLGLAIVDAVARAHGGTATAAGAAVTLVLPAHRPLIGEP